MHHKRRKIDCLHDVWLHSESVADPEIKDEGVIDQSPPIPSPPYSTCPSPLKYSHGVPAAKWLYLHFRPLQVGFYRLLWWFVQLSS